MPPENSGPGSMPGGSRRRLASFVVNGLFGVFSHPVQLKTEDHITIIHGPNGVGKTTVLRLVEALFKPRSRIWRTTEFTSVVATFLPSGTLEIKPLAASEQRGVSFRLKDGDREESAEVRGVGHPDIPINLIDDIIPHLQRVDEASWHDRRRGEILDLEEVLERYGERLPFGDDARPAPIPEWLTEFFAGLATQFIQTQRLRARRDRSASVHRRPVDTEHAVEGLAAHLLRGVRESVRDSGTRGASLDRTFPKRLLEGDLPGDATEEHIRHTYQSLEKLRTRLMKAGLLDTEEQVPLPTTALSEHDRKVLWYYLADVQEKLRIHQPLLERIELFKDIIDDKDFLYKSMILDKESGFSFVSDNGAPVPLPALSSGEQHELVLAYELLFKSQGKQLILIDEPELSLHVTWQQRFLRDMEEIARLTNLDFIIATHSPSIVNHRTDLMVELSRDNA